MAPEDAFIATQPPQVMTVEDGTKVKFLALLLMILVNTLSPSVVMPHDAPPPKPPGPASCIVVVALVEGFHLNRPCIQWLH